MDSDSLINTSQMFQLDHWITISGSQDLLIVWEVNAVDTWNIGWDISDQKCLNLDLD